MNKRILLFMAATGILTLALYQCGVGRATSSHRDQNARLRLELYEVTKARDDLRDMLEPYANGVLRQERDSLAGLVAAMREDLNRRADTEADLRNDLEAEIEDRLALELAVQELRYRDSILTLINANWLVEYSRLRDSLLNAYLASRPVSPHFRPRTYKNSIGGLAAFLLLLAHLFRKRK